MPVEVGKPAPDFTLPNHHGEPVTLSSFRGRRNVVVVFYPWAFTSVCTSELRELAERRATFDSGETVTLAVSCDAKFSLRIFAEREGYPFDLLSDHWPHGEVSRAYGVFDEESGVPTRGTFIIDKQGVVRYRVIHAIPDARNADEYEQALAVLS